MLICTFLHVHPLSNTHTHTHFLTHALSLHHCTQGADIMVTGTLGLAAPATRAALLAAAQAVKAGGGKVFVDVNWRPVFWEDMEAAKAEITSFLELADIVKISDADLEYLYDMQFVTALLNPCAVRVRRCTTCRLDVVRRRRACCSLHGKHASGACHSCSARPSQRNRSQHLLQPPPPPHARTTPRSQTSCPTRRRCW